MGNCQAIDAAALVIQHPSGKLERMYWPVTASEVMKMNPGHYVSLIIPIPISGDDGQENSDVDNKTVRFTRVKLLRPSDTLVLGRAYRLVTTQEVMKVLRAKKNAKTQRSQSESGEDLQMHPGRRRSTGSVVEDGRFRQENNDQAIRLDRHRQRSGPTNNIAARRSISWRPSLQSISESGNSQLPKEDGQQTSAPPSITKS